MDKDSSSSCASSYSYHVCTKVIRVFLLLLLDLKAKFQCHPARCLLPVEIMQRCGLATDPATVELLPYLLPY